MPTERRRIIFSDDEIVSAALAHCRATGIAVPDADVQELCIETDKDCGLLLTFAVDTPDQTDEVRIDADDVLAALVSYCRTQCVPLPNAAAKRLDPREGALSMVFELQRQRGSVTSTIAA